MGPTRITFIPAWLVCLLLQIGSVGAKGGTDWSWNQSGISARFGTEEGMQKLFIVNRPVVLVAKVDAPGFSGKPLVFGDSILLLSFAGRYATLDLGGKPITSGQLQSGGTLSQWITLRAGKAESKGLFAFSLVKDTAVTLVVASIERGVIREIERKPLPYIGLLVEWGDGVYVIGEPGATFVKLDAMKSSIAP